MCIGSLIGDGMSSVGGGSFFGFEEFSEKCGLLFRIALAPEVHVNPNTSQYNSTITYTGSTLFVRWLD